MGSGDNDAKPRPGQVDAKNADPGRVDAWVSRRFWLVLTVLVLVMAAAYVTDAVLLVRGLDLRVYRAGGYAWLHDVPLYSDRFPPLLGVSQPLQFTYPPMSAILFVPMALLPFTFALVVHEVISIASLFLTCLLVGYHRFASPRTAVIASLAITSVAPALEPVRETLHFGQINLLLMLMIAVDCLLPRDRLRWLPRGVLTGIAAAVKLTPAVFVLYFLARKDWKGAATSVGTFIAAAGLAFALGPRDSKEYWLHALLDPDRIGEIVFSHNQSFNATLYRLGLTGELRSALWLFAALVIVVLGVLAARRALRQGDQLGAMFVVAAVGLFASPVSWDHHWVWIAPAMFVLVSAIRRSPGWKRWVSVLIIALYVLPPHAILPNMDDAELEWTWWQHLIGNTYLYTAVGVVIYVLVRRAPAATETTATTPAKQAARAR
ncbi:glycosyltransferase 87 family protein [Labedaea rhizosphaerae]|uniref:Alpha-1,2-mannosyltransferase n=1 Tax=Labedaea rhizosphaerae TaxID=598644 RepID=A0A4R6SE02_LABRH|nr:glycosyltransferase 87 family protein [Labedaea rhizosphaerae]TDP97873.1 alpha-1,2-mannosyltransferase [Labedaea rhizosphaerae]